MPKKHLSTRIDETLKQQLVRHAKKRKRSHAFIVEEALELYFTVKGVK